MDHFFNVLEWTIVWTIVLEWTIVWTIVLEWTIVWTMTDSIIGSVINKIQFVFICNCC